MGRSRVLVFPVSSAENLDLHLGDSARVEAEALGAADGDIDDAACAIRPAIGNMKNL